MEESSTNETQKEFITPLSNCENIDPNNVMETTSEDSFDNVNKNALNMVNFKPNITVDINFSDTCVSSSGETSSVYDSTLKNILTRKKLMFNNIQDKKISIGIDLDDTNLNSDSDSFQTNPFPKAIIFNRNNISLNKSMELSLNNSVDTNIPNSDTSEKTQERPKPSAMVLEMQKELNTVLNTQDIDKQTSNVHNGSTNFRLHNSDNASINTVSDSREMELTDLLCKSTPQNCANQEHETVGSLEMDLTYVKVPKAKNMSSQMDIDSFESNVNEGSEAVETKEQENCFEKDEDIKILDKKPNTQKESIENAEKHESPNKPEIDLQSSFQNPCPVFDTHEIKITQGIQKSAIPVLKNKQISELNNEGISFHSPNPCVTTVFDTQEMEIRHVQKSAIPVLKNKQISELHNEEKSFHSPNPCTTVFDSQEMEMTQDVQKSAIPVVKNKQISELNNEGISFHSPNPSATTLFDTQEMEITQDVQKSAIPVVKNKQISELHNEEKSFHSPNPSATTLFDTQEMEITHDVQKSAIPEVKNKQISELHNEEKSFHSPNPSATTLFDTQEMEITHDVQKSAIPEVKNKQISELHNEEKSFHSPNPSATTLFDTQEMEITHDVQKSAIPVVKNKQISELHNEEKSFHSPNPCATTLFDTQEMETTETFQKFVSSQNHIPAPEVDSQEINSENKNNESTQAKNKRKFEANEEAKNIEKSEINEPFLKKKCGGNSPTETQMEIAEVFQKDVSSQNNGSPTLEVDSQTEINDEKSTQKSKKECKSDANTEKIRNIEIEEIKEPSQKNIDDGNSCTELQNVASTQKTDNGTDIVSESQVPEDDKLSKNLDPTFDSSLESPKIINKLLSSNLKQKKISVQIDFNTSKSISDASLNDSDLIPKAKIFHAIPPKESTFSELDNLDKTENKSSQTSDQITIPENPIYRYSHINKSEYTICLSLDSLSDSNNSNPSLPNLESEVVLMPRCIEPNDYKSKESIIKPATETLKNLPETAECNENTTFENTTSIAEPRSEIIQKQDRANTSLPESQPILSQEYTEKNNTDTDSIQSQASTIISENADSYKNTSNETINTSLTEQFRSEIIDKKSIISKINISECPDLIVNDNILQLSVENLKNLPANEELNPTDVNISFENQLLSTSEMITENANANSSKIELPVTENLIKNTELSQINVNNITQDISVNKSKNQLLSTIEPRRSNRSSVKNSSVNSSKIELLPNEVTRDLIQNTEISQTNINDITQIISKNQSENEPLLISELRRSRRSSGKNVSTENANAHSSKIELPVTENLIKNTELSQINVNNITQDISVNKSKNQLLSTVEPRRSKRSSVKNSSVNSSKIELLPNEVTRDVIKNTEISQTNINDITQIISKNQTENEPFLISELRRSRRSSGKKVSTENANAHSSKIELPVPEETQNLIKNTELSQINVNNITQDISVNKSKNQLLSTVEPRRSKRSSVKNSSVNSSKIELLPNEVTQDLIKNTEISQTNINDITQIISKNQSENEPFLISELRRSRRNSGKNVSTENANAHSSKIELPVTEEAQNLIKNTELSQINVNNNTQDISVNKSNTSDESSKNLNESKPRRKGFLKSSSEKSNESSKFNFTKPQLPTIDLSKGTSMEHTRKKRITFRPSDENSIINYSNQPSQSSKNSTENNLRSVKSKASEKQITDLSCDTSLELSVIPQEHQRKKRLIFHSTPVRKRYSDSQNLNSKSEFSSFCSIQEEEIIDQDEIQEAMDVEPSVISEENVEVELNESVSPLQSEVVSLPNESTNYSASLLTTYDTESDDDFDSTTTSESLKSVCSSKKDESFILPFSHKKVKKDRQSEKPKRLFKPVKWMNKKFYTYLENKLKSKYQLNFRKIAEEFAIFLFNTYSLVINGHNKESAISELKIKMKELNLCTNNLEFYMYIYDFTPFEFRRLVLPLGGAYGSAVGTRTPLYDPL